MAFLIPHNPRAPETSPELAKLLPLWERLAFTPTLPDPFCSGPHWQLACHESFQAERRIYLKHTENSLLAFTEMRDDAAHRVFLPLDADWLFGTTLLGPEAPDLLEETAAELAASPPLLAIYLSGMEGNSVFTGLARRLGKYFHFATQGESIQCMASLAGGLDGFLARRSPHHRAKLKRARRGARSAGIVFERHVPTNALEVIQIYQRLLAIERKSWKGRQHCGMTEPAPCLFYANLLLRLAPWRASRIIVAARDGEDIGFIFGSLGGRIYRGQQFSYASQCAHLSLGHVLQMEMIAWLCEEGIERYDLGPCSGPRMQYKLHWIDHVRLMRTVALVLRI